MQPMKSIRNSRFATFAYSVSRRRREIGIRMAVGATTSRVFGMVILDGLRVSIPGITIGTLIMLLGAAGLAQAPAKPRDPLVYAAATLLLIAVTILSCYYPARRAARIEPNECLRCE